MKEKSLIEKLEERMQDPDYQKEMNIWFSKYFYSRDRGKEKISKMIDSLSDEELDIWFSKFFKWEEKYEDYCYDYKHTITSSEIFNSLYEFILDRGTDVSNVYNEDFLSVATEWKGYVFKLYQGQGCFWRILKNGNCIFQTK